MRFCGSVFILACCFLVSTIAAAQKTFVEPVHPDTLPTLQRNWSLPAGLAPQIVNAYAPRLQSDEKNVFVYDHHGRRLVAAQLDTGKVLWNVPVNTRSNLAFANTPLIAQGQVVVASDGYVSSFDTKTGKMKWELGTKGLAVNGLASSKHHFLLPWVKTSGVHSLSGVNLWAIDGRQGTIEWTKTLPGSMAFVAGDSEGVYYVASNGLAMGLTADRGDVLWQNRLGGDVTEPPILQSGKLYVRSLKRKGGQLYREINILEVAKGKTLWSTKISGGASDMFLVDQQLATIEDNGQLTLFDAQGKKRGQLRLRLDDQPTSLRATASGKRIFIFSAHPDGHGYIWLTDNNAQKILATANALDMNIRALLAIDKLMMLDGEDGTVYAYRIDRSLPPKRSSVPAEEFAAEILSRVRNANAWLKGLPAKLAGLGPKALPAIEQGLESNNPWVVQSVAQAIGYLGQKRSVPALLKALANQQKSTENTPERLSVIDPLIDIVAALAELRDAQSIPELQKLLKDEKQNHFRRRAAFVALGAIGVPAAQNAIMAFRNTHTPLKSTWSPQAFTPSFNYKIEEDVVETALPTQIRQQTAIESSGSKEKWEAILSPYLGGYNDVWVGKSSTDGAIEHPLFTGLTRPESKPNKRIKLETLKFIDAKNTEITFAVAEDNKNWRSEAPVKFSPESLSVDRDKDGLPDIVETRLRLAINNPDSDGDGIKDSEDLNPLASAKQKLTVEQKIFREAFFAYYAFLKRRGLVVVDPGEGSTFEVTGRRDPVLSLRRATSEKLRKEIGLHAVDYVSFGGPYPTDIVGGEAQRNPVWNKTKTEAQIGMDISRSGDNAVAYNVTLKKVGNNWVVTRFSRAWTTNN